LVTVFVVVWADVVIIVLLFDP